MGIASRLRTERLVPLCVTGPSSVENSMDRHWSDALCPMGTASVLGKEHMLEDEDGGGRLFRHRKKVALGHVADSMVTFPRRVRSSHLSTTFEARDTHDEEWSFV